MATTQTKISFAVDRKEVVLVKPFKPTPSEVLSCSTIDNDPNLELICHSVFVYQANGDTPDEVQKDPACIIEEALSKVLVYYYPLAGKLKRQSDGRLQITCNNADDDADGVPFLVATAHCQLSSLNYLDGIDVETAKQFAFDFVDSKSNDHGYHPLVLQVTKFSCGGFTIAMSLSHSVCDGFGLRRILNPPLPEGFYGNAFTSANASMTGKDLNEGSLAKAVKQIKESKKVAYRNENIWKLMSILEKLNGLNMKFEGRPGSTMVITDWRQLGLMEDIDFGWKGHVNMIPLPWNMFGYVDLVLLLPPCKLDQSMKGGVRVLVSLPRAAIAKFKEEMDALKHSDECAGA
ncbi:Transferase [Corchorus olitorius]|uniref:Transferase n=1 Tax=Corchorus olitorius TaxID=93759 RepID=A0A1R3K5U9_9ROSI|nr:Transferase [Corchorus olitorius]